MKENPHYFTLIAGATMSAMLTLTSVACTSSTLTTNVAGTKVEASAESPASVQTGRKVKVTLDMSTLIGKTTAQVKAALGKPNEIGQDDCDKLPEWTFKRPELKYFAIKFEGGKVSDVFASFNDVKNSPETCLKIMGLRQADWAPDPSTSSDTQHSYLRGKLWVGIVLQQTKPVQLTIQITGTE